MAAAGAPLGGAPALFSLLRSILRLHRQRLPPPMRAMGDTYVLSEFRQHLKGGTTEAQWRAFAGEWRRYAAMLGGTADQLAALAPAQPSSSAPGQEQQQQQQQQRSGDVASVVAAIGGGHRDMTEALLEELSPDQRRQVARLQEEARALGAALLGGRPEGGRDGSSKGGS